MLRKIILLACSSVVAYTGMGFAVPADAGQYARKVAIDAPANRSVLLSIIERYHSDPMSIASGQGLTSEDNDVLRQYVEDSRNSNDANLTFEQKATLSQVIHSRPDLFSARSLAAYNMTEQRGTGLSDEDLSNMNGLVQDIRDGKALTQDQHDMVMNLAGKMNGNEYAFSSELDVFAQYANLNGDMFSSRDVSNLRDATAAAAGLNNSDRKTLRAIADRNDDVQSLNAKDAAALQALVAKAPLGALNALSPAQAIAIDKVVKNNDKLFAPGMDRFNSAFNNNEAIHKAAAAQNMQQNNSNVRGSRTAPAEQQNRTQRNQQPLNSDSGPRSNYRG